MTLREKIDCMKAFERGEEIEVNFNGTEFDGWIKDIFPSWNWAENDYRIKHQPKKTVTIEKWLVTNKSRFDIVETSNIDEYIDGVCMWTKVKLLDTYEVEI